MLKALTETLSNGDQEDAAQDVLNLFIELAEKEPRFFRRQLVAVVSDLFEIAYAKSLEEETKHLTVEFLLTLVEAKKKAPGMMKKLPSFTNTCFAMILNMLLDIEDEPSWYSTDMQHEYAGETENCTFGEKCLDRFSIAFGGKTIVPIAMEQMEAYLVAPEWQKRHTSLRALLQISEGNSKEVAAFALTEFYDSEKLETLLPYLDRILNKLLVLLENDNQMVQREAIEALIDIADLSKEHFRKFYDLVMP